jgi:oligopeptide/dipeptide ABC transporter ATP-binding protein
MRRGAEVTLDATRPVAVDTPLLRVEDLRVDFGGPLPAVDGVSFTVRPGEIVGIAGESGSGKSVAAMAVTRLLPDHARVSGRVLLSGDDLMAHSEKQLAAVRGSRIGMVFQDPVNSLNPVLRIGRQLMDVARAHGARTTAQARAACVAAVEEVALDAAVLDRYSIELSGGMCQRVGIAIGLIGGAPLLIADEPTTALDVTVQAQVLTLLRRLCRERGMSCVFISHDLAVLAQICDRVVVMYRGQVMESGTRDEVLGRPAHPYTKGLLDCVVDEDTPGSEFREIGAAVREEAPRGCRFYSRCPLAVDTCAGPRPDLTRYGGVDHLVRCVRPGEILGGVA